MWKLSENYQILIYNFSGNLQFWYKNIRKFKYYPNIVKFWWDCNNYQIESQKPGLAGVVLLFWIQNSFMLGNAINLMLEWFFFFYLGSKYCCPGLYWCETKHHDSHNSQWLDCVIFLKVQYRFIICIEKVKYLWLDYQTSNHSFEISICKAQLCISVS